MRDRSILTAKAAMAVAAGVLALGGQALFAPVAAQSQAPVQAGVSAAVRGTIEVASIGATVGRLVKSGEDIFLGDKIDSGDRSGMQVLLMDETVFTIGANASLVIDEFVYNPETDTGKVAANVLKGAFRFVTGRVAKRQPSSMTVRLPVGSIGIRGTIAGGRVDGERSLVVLLGPGANTNSGERVGRILRLECWPNRGDHASRLRDDRRGPRRAADRAVPFAAGGVGAPQPISFQQGGSSQPDPAMADQEVAAASRPPMRATRPTRKSPSEPKIGSFPVKPPPRRMGNRLTGVMVAAARPPNKLSPAPMVARHNRGQAVEMAAAWIRGDPPRPGGTDGCEHHGPCDGCG